MRSRYTVVDPEGIYFLTATVIEWIPVFIGKDTFDILTGALAFCRKEKASGYTRTCSWKITCTWSRRRQTSTA